MKNKCPVCFYDGLLYPPVNHSICPCCGTEFGLDDYDFTVPELRLRWILSGALWFSRDQTPPANWNPSLQLLSAQYGVRRTSPSKSITTKKVTPRSIQFTPVGAAVNA